MGAHIAVYDALSGSLCQTLTSPNSEKTTFVHFIGTDGRYLLATYSKSLVMWDLIDSSGAFPAKEKLSADRAHRNSYSRLALRTTPAYR